MGESRWRDGESLPDNHASSHYHGDFTKYDFAKYHHSPRHFYVVRDHYDASW